ncbi:unnamed protein product [Sphagnum jensenii]|uniref:Protein kinase domain-containing protein n=1 Tax=Sphagnum jensenii TaxID=128206 RepID=A0ABP1B5Z9_9BRYO
MFSLKGFLQYCIVTRLLVILFVNPSSCVSHAQPLSFTFVNFNSSYLEQIILVDDAIQWESKYILLDSVNTAFGEGRYYGCGKLIYKEKVQMLHPSTGAVASFKTSFTFTIFPPSGDSSKHFGHGFAFTFMEDNHTVGVAGDSMCVVTLGTQGQITNTFFAVEFDTYLNPYYDDPSDSHIGVNVNSFMSLTTYNLCNLIGNHTSTSCRYFITANTKFTAWIEYDGTTEWLDIWFANGSISSGIVKPKKPVIHYNLNQSHRLFKVLSHEYMYVGFSGSSGLYSEINQIESWSFASSGLPLPSYIALPEPILKSNYVKDLVPIVVAICVGGVAIFLLVVKCFVLYHQQQRRNWNLMMDYGSDLYKGQRFTYKEICIATKDFSEAQLLGSGGHGSVYKGFLQETGSLVAVKRITRESRKGESDFIAEISVISQIRHRYLVQLRGWCQEKENLLLVYDYMSNKSLDKWLFETPRILDVQSPHVLQWEVRYNIVTGVAAAVHYLHEEWEQCIIHRDIKASNVLLDAQFQAHLGNFGLARFTDHDKSSRTTMLAGTLGYLAPELQHTGKATKSTDVYSFGILALEIACGRSALSEIDSQSQLVLLDYVWQEHKNKSIFNVVDPRLEMNFVEDQMLRVLHVGLLCCHPVPLVRPSTRLVYQYLKGDKSVPSPPKFEPMAISY